jgi:hypothetical protein
MSRFRNDEVASSTQCSASHREVQREISISQREIAVLTILLRECKQPIVENYLREVGTNLIYGDENGYTDRCKNAARILARQARAS